MFKFVPGLDFGLGIQLELIPVNATLENQLPLAGILSALLRRRVEVGSRF